LPAAMGGRQHYLEHLRRLILAAQAQAVIAPASMASWAGEACDGLALRYAGTYDSLSRYGEGNSVLPAPNPDTLAYLQFSSGSTRFPRGVAVTQRAVMANTRGIVRDGLKAGEGDRCVNWLPMYHDMGLVGFMLAPLTCHISVDYLPTHEFGRRPLGWLDLISRNRGTLSYSPSFGYQLCVRRASRGVPADLDLSSWRVAGIGGDMIRPHVLAEFAQTFASVGFRSRAYVASYGMAEASLALSFAPLGTGLRVDHVDSEHMERDGVVRVETATATGRTRDFVLCGPILPVHQVEIRDTNGQALPAGRVGVVHVCGPSLMREYFGDPEESARVLSADGWLDTGDLGYLSNGEIVITGRAKDLILLNGRNIWPQDLEWTAEAEVEGVRSSSVAAFSLDKGNDPHVVVLFECRRGERKALSEAIAGVLRSRHGVEAQVIPVLARSLPRTSSGKLSRAKARQMFLHNGFEESGVVAA
ncbi:MAG: fatty acyl-AMP ligase, partial [Sinobacteraceae bacterium]|nr:fatty acyl-AMP ligase [Nevskiaceae bacterium]